DLALEVALHAITLVRDDAKLIDSADGAGLRSAKRIFILGITNGEDRGWIANPFIANMVWPGRLLEFTTLDSRSTDEEVRGALESAGKADVVIAAMYGRVRSGAANSVGLPEQGARALSSLLERKARVVGISFGNPYLLQNFPALRTYVVAYGDMPSLQTAAALAITRRSDITGRLPISLPNLYARGTGIQLRSTVRPLDTTTKAK
ncbi:MAG: beta-N-acetylhexosaminidase, partial [Acidobacteriota bacterium]|nr:beta-N-acetylhexosaminidase [Acidobacteriota bacterium]